MSHHDRPRGSQERNESAKSMHDSTLRYLLLGFGLSGAILALLVLIFFTGY